MPPPGQNALDNNRPPDDNPNGTLESDTDSQESTGHIDPQEPSSSRDIVERNLVLELYQALTRTGGNRRPADVILSDCPLYDQDRDEVVTTVMRLLTNVCTDEILGPADISGIKKLFVALKNDFACGAMVIRRPDAGLNLNSAWHVRSAETPGTYPTGHIYVWYWAIRAGADEVIKKLEDENVSPGNGVEVVQDLHLYIIMAVDHLRKVLSIHDNALTWKWEDNAFVRANIAIHALLLMFAGRYGFSAQYLVTQGTGLLHWLVHCQRMELRDKAFDFAESLLCDSGDDGTKYTPSVDVNECFDIRQARHQVADSGELGVVNMETPLHGAVFFGWEEMVKLLLRHGADVEKRGDRRGLTPYGLATKLDGLEDICIAIEDDKARTDLERGDTKRHFGWWNYDQASLEWAEGNRQRQELLTRLQTRVADDSGTRQGDPNAEVGAGEDAPGVSQAVEVMEPIEEDEEPSSVAGEEGSRLEDHDLVTPTLEDRIEDLETEVEVLQGRISRLEGGLRAPFEE